MCPRLEDQKEKQSNDLQDYVLQTLPGLYITSAIILLFGHSAVGAALAQVVNYREHVIVKHYHCVIRKELLAVVNGLKYFHSYLYGQEVTK